MLKQGRLIAASLTVLLALSLGWVLHGMEREGTSGPAPGTRTATALFEPVTEAQRKAVVRGLEFLVQNQDPHKGFFRPLYEDGQKARVAVTALACLSLLANGNTDGRGPYAEGVSRGIRYLMRTADLQSVDELRGYIATPGDDISRMHGHGYATLALAEAYGMFGENPRAAGSDYSGARLRQHLTAAVRLIERSQTRQGGWGYHPESSGDHEGSITVCQLQALRSARNAGITVNPITIKRATEYLKLSQEPDGSFAYSLQDRRSSYALTAAAISTLHARGIYDSKELRAGMDYMLRRFERFLARPAYFYYGAFYAGQSMYHSSNPSHFEQWFTTIRAELLRTQMPDGSWTTVDDTEEFGRTYCTAMATLILQLPYGYLPIFQK